MCSGGRFGRRQPKRLSLHPLGAPNAEFLRIMQSLSGQELRRRRLRLGISRDQLAHSVGVPPAMVLAWEEDAAEVACPNALRQILQQSDEQWPGSMDSMN